MFGFSHHKLTLAKYSSLAQTCKNVFGLKLPTINAR